MNEEELEKLSTDEVTVTRAARTQARVMNSTNTSDTGEKPGQSGSGILITVLVLFLVVITAGMSFLIYVTLGNEKKYEAMEEQITAIEQRLPNTGQAQGSADSSKILKPTTTGSEATNQTQTSGVGTEPSSGVAQPNPNGTKTYIVQNGDTLSAIAAINGMNIDDLRSMNDLADDVLYEGQVLNVKAEATQ